MWPNPQFSADLVTFTEEILNGKLHFLYNAHCDHCVIVASVWWFDLENAPETLVRFVTKLLLYQIENLDNFSLLYFLGEQGTSLGSFDRSLAPWFLVCFYKSLISPYIAAILSNLNRKAQNK